jgi:quercetin dioxygenase-like cupin family protein
MRKNLKENSMISLNKDMVLTETRPGMAVRRPIHDPSHLKVAEWTIQPGMTFPAHAHDNDKITYIVKGKMVLEMDGKDYILDAGSYYYTPAGQVTQTKEIVETVTMIVIDEVKK